jgi:hypothetical protein
MLGFGSNGKWYSYRADIVVMLNRGMRRLTVRWSLEVPVGGNADF